MSDLPYSVILACDLRRTSGEGRLALLQIKNLKPRVSTSDLSKIYQVKKTPQILSPNFQSKFRFVHSVLSYSWLVYHVIRLKMLRIDNVLILNYLPLWNSFFFLIVPKSFGLGPITGGGVINTNHLNSSNRKKILLQITRNTLIPVLYKLSSFIIRWRFLDVKPATRSVAKELNVKNNTPRAIEIDESPFEALKHQKKNQNRKIDFVSYVGSHPLKNTVLTVSVLNRLAAIGYNVYLIGAVSGNIRVHQNIKYYKVLPHKKVMDIVRDSLTVLSLSLEEAGFFTFEASVCGSLVLCLPDTGGAALPGAKLLAKKTERLTEELLFDRCLEVMKSISNTNDTESRKSALALRKIHEHAKAYFHQN